LSSHDVARHCWNVAFPNSPVAGQGEQHPFAYDASLRTAPAYVKNYASCVRSATNMRNAGVLDAAVQ
jgi:hypothetical protein